MDNSDFGGSIYLPSFAHCIIVAMFFSITGLSLPTYTFMSLS